MNNIPIKVHFRQYYEMKIMRRYYLQFGESLMDIEERYYEHIKISSGDAICSNSAKNIND